MSLIKIQFGKTCLDYNEVIDCVANLHNRLRNLESGFYDLNNPAYVPLQRTSEGTDKVRIRALHFAPAYAVEVHASLHPKRKNSAKDDYPDTILVTFIIDSSDHRDDPAWFPPDAERLVARLGLERCNP